MQCFIGTPTIPGLVSDPVSVCICFIVNPEIIVSCLDCGEERRGGQWLYEGQHRAQTWLFPCRHSSGDLSVCVVVCPCVCVCVREIDSVSISPYLND